MTDALRHDITFATVRPLLAGAKRVLEVGCGRGELARRLAASGFEVTALDLHLDPSADSAENPRFLEQDFLIFAETSFDAVLFTSSLHHITPLDAAIDRARAILRPSGSLIADEFALEAPDEQTARWSYEAQHLLVAAGLMRSSDLRGTLDDPPLQRWIDEHHHHVPLSTSTDMVAAIEARFENVEVTPGPYLFRWIAHALIPGDRSAAVAAHIYQREKALIDAGVLRAVGRLIAAR